MFYSKDDFEKAIEEHERALRLREVLGRKIDIAVAFRTLGECYCKKKDYTKAHNLHERYLLLARYLGQIKNICSSGNMVKEISVGIFLLFCITSHKGI